MKKIKFNFTNKLITYINCLLVFLLTLIIYVSTLAPTVTCEDSGELITAGYYLGVPHPPGYPTWCLLSHPFSYIPIKSIAWRFNFSSAFFASVTNAVLYLIILKLTGGVQSVALVVSLLFAFSTEFWEQSVITEVYSLNALMIALCFLFLIQWEYTQQKKWLYIMGVIMGLGLGTHPTMYVLLPIFLGYIVLQLKNKKEKYLNFLITVLISIVVWLLTCLYLYLASKSNPPVDWGNPETIHNLLRHIFRKQYQFMIHQYPRSLSRLLKQLYVFYAMGCEQFGSPLILFLVAIGFIVLFRKNLRWCLLLLFASFTIGTSATLVQNFNFDKEWLSIMSVFGIPIYMFYTIALGTFLSEILRITLRKPIKRFLTVVIFILPLIALIKNYERNNFSNYWWGYEFGKNILNSLEENSVLIPYSDHTTFTAIYLQEVENIRKDVKLGIKYGYFNLEIFGPDKRDYFKARYGEFPLGRYIPELVGWLIDNTNYPIYSEQELKVKCNTKGKWVPAGILYRFQRENEEVPPPKCYWDKYKWVHIRAENIKDLASSLIWLQIQWAKARDAYIEGDIEKARELVKKGINIYGEDDVILNNAGVLCAKYGDYALAESFFIRGYEINHSNETIKNNLHRLKKKKLGKIKM